MPRQLWGLLPTGFDKMQKLNCTSNGVKVWCLVCTRMPSDVRWGKFPDEKAALCRKPVASEFAPNGFINSLEEFCCCEGSFQKHSTVSFCWETVDTDPTTLEKETVVQTKECQMYAF